ncbi:Holin of 3TMs, for gene-transfer release [uncultured Caudovirales phage]|uniref:Holin of 3TMs, for gene-transfer release n=1 Tax=uncultured Caudovirales phage TaxID=2100421 RepID=A0A6J5S8Q4_9CAUD|nr:Holin of 3TMs, for gene-transfer release [uncultured Caudovirales phage]CAB4168561.1 Holin of 3TMs, for gene-transfer release [uncultured Caudovirales phage]CAB4196403.1 Holin of 3TMs, for gene-transfer release [uncultured Caudovirales phage]CAB4205378.1 Holin of 3TMs, for gene-transfer release [uncultured Caudovirales phage]
MFGIDDAIGAALKVLDKFVPDPAAKQAAESELRNSLQKWDEGQTEVNKVEAGSDNLFVAGWRPAIGWICAAALLYTYILVPFTVWTFAFVLNQPIPKFPVLDNNLWELMFGMLGMGGLRTYEKFKGVSK